MVEISTSILSIEKENAIKTFYNLETAGTNYFHIDVMDGEFVEKNTLEIMKDYAFTIKHISNLPLDVHLMVKNVEKHINEYIDFDPNIITIHLESFDNEKNLLDSINYIKENNIKVGISIKPNTNIEETYKYLPIIHQVLIMTVEPGKGGQELILTTVDKIKKLKKYLEENNLELDIEVDGGINLETANIVKNAGANILVSGTTIIESKNYKEIIRNLKK